MKSRFILLIVLNLIIVSSLSAHEKIIIYSQADSIQNEKILQLNNEIIALKKQIDENKNQDLPFWMNLITFIVTILTLITAILLTYFVFLIDNFKKKFKKVEREIKFKITSLDKTSCEIIQLNRDLSSHRTYLKESVELLFELNISFANIIKNKDWLRAIYIKRAISSLYSVVEKERFSGISALGESGGLIEIKHLENVIKNKEESENNKLLAVDAITKIKLRVLS